MMTRDNLVEVINRIISINKNLTEESMLNLLNASGWEKVDIDQALGYFRSLPGSKVVISTTPNTQSAQSVPAAAQQVINVAKPISTINPPESVNNQSSSYANIEQLNTNKATNTVNIPVKMESRSIPISNSTSTTIPKAEVVPQFAAKAVPYTPAVQQSNINQVKTTSEEYVAPAAIPPATQNINTVSNTKTQEPLQKVNFNTQSSTANNLEIESVSRPWGLILLNLALLIILIGLVVYLITYSA